MGHKGNFGTFDREFRLATSHRPQVLILVLVLVLALPDCRCAHNLLEETFEILAAA